MADMEAVKAALQSALALLDKSDLGAIAAKKKPAVAVTVDASRGDGSDEEDCPDCAAGDCLKHPGDDDMSALEAALSTK